MKISGKLKIIKNNKKTVRFFAKEGDVIEITFTIGKTRNYGRSYASYFNLENLNTGFVKEMSIQDFCNYLDLIDYKQID